MASEALISQDRFRFSLENLSSATGQPVYRAVAGKNQSARWYS